MPPTNSRRSADSKWERGGWKSFSDWLEAQHKAKKILMSTSPRLNRVTLDTINHGGSPYRRYHHRIQGFCRRNRTCLIKGSVYPAAINQLFRHAPTLRL